MGKYFNKYNIYKEALQGKNLTGPANSLSSSLANGITLAKTNFDQTNTSKWNELAKPSVSNIITSIQTSLTDLSTFVSSNLVVVCSKAEQLYEKVVEVIEKDEELDNLEERIKNTPSTKSVIENGKTITIDNPDYIVLNNSINELEAVLSALSESADALINDIKDFDGVDNIFVSSSSLDRNYNNFFGDIDIEALINEYGDDEAKIAEILAQNLKLPEGFKLCTDKASNFEGIKYGITGDYSGLVVKVGYKGLTGALYIPLDNATTNLGIILIGGNKNERYTFGEAHIFEENNFDSVVFIPNHNNGNNKEKAYQNSDIEVLKKWIKSLEETYGLETITGNAHSNGCKDMTNLIVSWNKTEESKFSKVLLMNPSSNILYNQKIDIPSILKENNVIIETGARDGYYASIENNYVAKTVIEKYSSIGGGVFVQDNPNIVFDKYEKGETNDKYKPQNKHSCRWFTYLSGSFTDSNGKEWKMKSNIDSIGN